jgi:enoyl-CoA hydratase/carnithine racemase
LLFKVENGVGWIVLNRPEARNALNAEMRQAYLDALARCGEDETIRAVVLTGRGRASARARICRDRARRPVPRLRPIPARRATRCDRASA